MGLVFVNNGLVWTGDKTGCAVVTKIAMQFPKGKASTLSLWGKPASEAFMTNPRSSPRILDSHVLVTSVTFRNSNNQHSPRGRAGNDRLKKVMST